MQTAIAYLLLLLHGKIMGPLSLKRDAENIYVLFHALTSFYQSRKIAFSNPFLESLCTLNMFLMFHLSNHIERESRQNICN